MDAPPRLDDFFCVFRQPGPENPRLHPTPLFLHHKRPKVWSMVWSANYYSTSPNSDGMHASGSDGLRRTDLRDGIHACRRGVLCRAGVC